MSRDYKNRAESRSQGGASQRSCVVPFLAGALLGAFGVGIAWLQMDPGLMRSGAGLAESGVPRPAEPAKPAEPEPKQPPAAAGFRFDFPDLLREMEVVVPDEELGPDAAKAKPPAPAAVPGQPAVQTLPPKTQGVPPTVQVQPGAAPAAQPQPPAEAKAPREAFLLQLGSFRKASDAERLKAQLALQGVECRVQAVTVNNDTWHRVRAGPYRSRKDLDDVRARLKQSGVDSILVRIEG